VDTNRRRFVVSMLFDFKQIWFYYRCLDVSDIYHCAYEEEKCYELMDKH
jgi:hypothetical protein